MKSQIKYLIQLYYQIQKYRLSLGNQIRELKKSKKPYQILEGFYEQFLEQENSIKKHLRKFLKDIPIWNKFLKKVKGVGEVLASALITTIDISKAKTPSALWHYCGYHVVNGKAARRKRGEKISWNPFLKTICWKIGRQFLLLNSPYRKYYEKKKVYYFRKDKTLSKMHIHNRALRYMIKRFLVDFWLKWRELEGLPITLPYGVAKKIATSTHKKKSTSTSSKRSKKKKRKK